MNRPDPPTRHHTIALHEVAGDLAALASDGRPVADAAQRAIEDRVRESVVGKRSRVRRDIGGLSALAQVRFGVPGCRRRRFRLVHRGVDEGAREVVAIAHHEQGTVHRITSERLGC